MPMENDVLESAFTKTCEVKADDDVLQPKQIFEDMPNVEYIYEKLDLLILKVFNNEQLMQEKSLLIYSLQQINEFEYFNNKTNYQLDLMRFFQ
ncbi:7854_t:CDS:1, partial [Funneliformis geosporum]